jgi:hypothetical protein
MTKNKIHRRTEAVTSRQVGQGCMPPYEIVTIDKREIVNSPPTERVMSDK